MTIKDQDLPEIHGYTNAEQQQLVAKISKVAQQIQLVIPNTLEEAWQEVVRLEEQAVISTAKRGFLYLAIKSQCAHGEFIANLKEHGIGERDARNTMSVAKMLLALPESKRQANAILNMSKTRLVELARLPIDTIDALNDDDLGALNDLSVREFRKEIKKLTETAAKLQEDNAHLINELGNEKLRKEPTQIYSQPPLCVKVRSLAFAHSNALNHSLLELSDLVNALCRQRDHDQHARIGAAQSVYHHFLSVHIRLTHMLAQLTEEFGNEFLAGADNLPTFTEEEMQDAMANHEYLFANFVASVENQGGN